MLTWMEIELEMSPYEPVLTLYGADVAQEVEQVVCL